MPLTQIDAFIPAYESALVFCDLVTAVLLFCQFNVLRARALFVLASGYLFTAFVAISHELSFPHVFSPTGLLGAGPQITILAIHLLAWRLSAFRHRLTRCSRAKGADLWKRAARLVAGVASRYWRVLRRLSLLQAGSPSSQRCSKAFFPSSYGTTSLLPHSCLSSRVSVCCAS
ncbi:MAG TPA: MASE4 domain-containing protein [Bradyrhizobium sp.]|nr:MASE4 domain-containing protein [Bradyrhizobium sp.]